MEKPNFSKDNSDYTENDEIDLKDLFKFFVRNRLIIGTFTILFFLFLLFTLYLKKIFGKDVFK